MEGGTSPLDFLQGKDARKSKFEFKGFCAHAWVIGPECTGRRTAPDGAKVRCNLDRAH